METAKKYNLTFYVSELPSFTRRPGISVSRNIDGNSLNYEIASFLGNNGLEFIEIIKDEINSLDFTYEFKGYNIWGYYDAEYMEIRNYPPSKPVAIFNTGGTEVIVPVTDFLKILEEWKVFVESVPEPHWLDQR
ncbi:hypothetical protein JI747_001490 [Chryseobacterium sp. RG1]|uniref:Uncharacterized protein n=1 Tax=Chryseobacterium tagetis TaxID=2801334 RepID=A0ABS7ZVS7_9FLAO|nr:hypothetical protein [Chryseobacterium tagetis]MCA6065831.1 hypothetical protein [Chryseobacterium tagetis]